jgi:hypothetical protein
MAFKQGRRNYAIGLALVQGSALVFAGFTMGSGVMVHQSARSVRFTAYDDRGRHRDADTLSARISQPSSA